MGSIYTSCKRPLILLVLLALALRVGFVCTLPNDLIWGDSQDYHQVAINILAGHGPQLSDDSLAFRPPGYPFFLAGIYWCFGYQNLLPVRLIQAVLSALVVWQVFSITSRLFNRPAGMLAALIPVLDPFEIYFCGMILNETLFISLLLAAMYSVLRMQENWRWLMVAGVCLGLGSLAKPSLCYLPLFLIPFLAFWWRNWLRAAWLTAAVCVVQLAVLSPWLIRNHQRLGVYTLSTMDGRSLYEALGEGATGGPAMNIVKWPALSPGLNEVEQNKAIKTAAIQHARENPGWALRLSVRKFCRFWSPVLNFERFRTWRYSVMSAGWYLPVMALFFVAAWRHRSEWRDWLWLLAPAIYFMLLHAIFVGSVRYRTPIMPLICCIAGAAFARRSLRSDGPTLRHPDAPTKLSVIIPFLNEAQTLRQVVEELLKLPLDLEIILVNDGSTDGSKQTADKLAADHKNVKVLHHEKNHGKGMAIRTGLQAVTGDVIVIQDADLEYNPQDLVALWEPIEKNEAPVIYGSRTLGSRQHSYATFYWGGQLVGAACNLLYDSHLTDEPTCYKMMRTEILRNMKLDSTGFEFCPEVTAKILRQGIAIQELPIDYSPRSFQEGKKIRWTDGLLAIWTLLRYRFAD
jgi:hypothetical protein